MSGQSRPRTLRWQNLFTTSLWVVNLATVCVIWAALCIWRGLTRLRDVHGVARNGSLTNYYWESTKSLYFVFYFVFVVLLYWLCYIVIQMFIMYLLLPHKVKSATMLGGKLTNRCRTLNWFQNIINYVVLIHRYYI